MSMITFADKVTLNPQPSVARENKVIDDDMNEIKSVINNKVGDVDNLDTTSNTIVGAINELKNGEIYSTTETKTNKVWINNKPIYRIVYHINSVIDGNNYFGSTIGIDEFIDAYGILHRSNGNNVFLNTTHDSYRALIGMDRANYNQFNLVANYTSMTDAYVVIEYTKTS